MNNPSVRGSRDKGQTKIIFLRKTIEKLEKQKLEE